jgi:hypothetical protein
MRILTSILLLGALCAPSFTKAQNKNHIYLETGLLHCFFDGSPLMNTNYQNKANKPFNGLLINSLGIDYKRDFNSRNSLIIGYRIFWEIYDKNTNAYPIHEPVVGERHFLTVNINYCRTNLISDRISFIYGGGINFRHGFESIIITRGIIGYIQNDPNQPVYELLIENITKNDPGLNAFSGIEYTPLKLLTFSTKVDFLGTLRFNDRDGKKEMKEVYDSPQFPTRFDLSFNLGVGFNF